MTSKNSKPNVEIQQKTKNNLIGIIKTEVKTISGILVITAVACLTLVIGWFAYQGAIFMATIITQKEIPNFASVTFKDAIGNIFGPTGSNTVKTTILSTSCQENWSCGEWNNCIGSQQTRTCTDGCDNEKIEEQELKGTYCEQGTCNLEKGECQPIEQ